jgi:hypothetical protein
MKSTSFWDIKPCSPLIVTWRLGGTCCFRRQGRRISQAETNVKQVGKQNRDTQLMSCQKARVEPRVKIIFGQCELKWNSPDNVWNAIYILTRQKCRKRIRADHNKSVHCTLVLCTFCVECGAYCSNLCLRYWNYETAVISSCRLEMAVMFSLERSCTDARISLSCHAYWPLLTAQSNLNG